MCVVVNDTMQKRSGVKLLYKVVHRNHVESIGSESKKSKNKKRIQRLSGMCRICALSQKKTK